MEPIDLEMALLAVLDGKDSHIHRKVEVEEVDMQNMVVQYHCVNVACFQNPFETMAQVVEYHL